MSFLLVHNQDANQYEYHIEGHVCHITYKENDNKLHLTHTIVPDALGGRGIAKQLLIDVLEEIKRCGKKAVAECPYIVNFESKNPDYADVFVKQQE